VKVAALLLALAACSQSTRGTSTVFRPVLPTTARSTRDSVVAAVIHEVVVHGLPIFHNERTVVIRNDSGLISSSSLPLGDPVEFVLLDSVGIQDLANRVGEVNVLRLWQPVIGEDTARSGASNGYVWRQADSHMRRYKIFSVCAYRLRRVREAWQVDSSLGCGVS
jgi:hypothetical protein